MGIGFSGVEEAQTVRYAVVESAEADVVVDLKAKAVAAVIEECVLVLEQLLRESDLELNTITTTTAAAERSLLMVACLYKREVDVGAWEM